MNGTDGLPLRTWRLMDAHLDSTISVDEMQEFESLLLENEKAGRTFLEYARIHAELHLLAAARRVSPDGLEEGLLPPRPSQPIAPRLRRSHSDATKKTKSPLRGFFNGKAHRDSGAPGTRSVAAAMWVVVVLCAGMAASLLVMVGVLLNGIRVHFDQPGAQNPPQSASSPHAGSIAQSEAAAPRRPRSRN